MVRCQISQTKTSAGIPEKVSLEFTLRIAHEVVLVGQSTYHQHSDSFVEWQLASLSRL